MQLVEYLGHSTSVVKKERSIPGPIKSMVMIVEYGQKVDDKVMEFMLYAIFSSNYSYYGEPKWKYKKIPGLVQFDNYSCD